MSDHDDHRNERAENGDGERVVVRDRRRSDPVTGEVQTALKGTDINAIKSAMEKLATESQKMGSALYQQPGAQGPGAAGAAGGDGQQAQNSADDVVDAEIVDEEKDKK